MPKTVLPDVEVTLDEPGSDAKPSASDLAVSEVIDPKKMVSVSFNDVIYTFRRKGVDSWFRYYIQKRQDTLAFERLLGEEQFLRFLNSNSDGDGDVSFDVYNDFTTKISEALGTPNS